MSSNNNELRKESCPKCNGVAFTRGDGVYCAPVQNQALSVAPAPVAAYTEFMIERLNIALDHIRSGVPHMASACLLADISRLKADLVESAPPAQSIPAAPCQCKLDDTTGWTDDDIMVPRCNVCGLVVMKVIAERKAERLLAGN